MIRPQAGSYGAKSWIVGARLRANISPTQSYVTTRIAPMLELRDIVFRIH